MLRIYRTGNYAEKNRIYSALIFAYKPLNYPYSRRLIRYF